MGFAFPSLCTIASSWKGQDYSWFGVAPMWAQSAGVRALCLTQEDAPDCSHSP